MVLLEIKELKVYFATSFGRVKAVNDVSFRLDRGETLALVGESGSGKSVIGHSILRLLPKSAVLDGQVLFQGEDLLRADEKRLLQIRGKQISLVPQNPAASLNPLVTNGKQMSEVFEQQGLDRDAAWKRMLSTLNSLLIRDPGSTARNYPHQLSGGMKQRLVAGIAISCSPKLIVADEPTKGIDYEARSKAVDLFRNIKEKDEGAMILITHDLDLAGEVCDRVAVMYAGEIVEMGPANEVLDQPEHSYTRGLISSLPRKGLKPLQGSSPSLVELPRGCFFQDRCVLLNDRCLSEHPLLKMNSDRWVRCHHHC